jgi:hypothetical protein
MSWSISEAMTDPAVKQPMAFHSEYKFFLRDIPTEITLRFYNPFHSSQIVVRQSHRISIPGLNLQDRASCEDDSQDGDVLQAVISEFVCNYNAAIAKGLKPESSWLQADPTFC